MRLVVIAVGDSELSPGLRGAPACELTPYAVETQQPRPQLGWYSDLIVKPCDHVLVAVAEFGRERVEVQLAAFSGDAVERPTHDPIGVRRVLQSFAQEAL